MEAAAAGGTQAQIGGSVASYSLTVDGSGTVTSGPGDPCLTGITRTQSYSQFLASQTRTFQAETTAVNFDAGSTAMLLNTTFSPTISHWGSSVIMDGGFDKDLGFLFNYSVSGVSVGGGTGSTLLLFRPAPAVSNTLPGEFGEREIVNRAQITLKNIEINNISGREYQIYAIVNPSNIGAATWINANVQTVNTASLFQPSFAQVATQGGTLVGTTNNPVDGEILFQFIGTSTGSETFDLTGLKEVQNSIISGPGTFPDGPETIALYIVNNNNQAGTFDIVLSWTEAQA
jgi:hypothetical protein